MPPSAGYLQGLKEMASGLAAVAYTVRPGLSIGGYAYCVALFAQERIDCS